MSNFNSMPEVNICLLLFSALLVLVMLIGAIADDTKMQTFMRYFILLLVTDILMQLGEAGIWLFEGHTENIPLVKLFCIMSFGCGNLLIAFYTCCLLAFCRESEDISLLPAYIMAGACGIMFLLILLSVFNGMFFTFDDQGYEIDGPLSFVINIFDIVTFLSVICLIIRYRRFFTIRELTALLSFCVLPFSAMLSVNIWYPTPEYLAITLSLIVVFTLFHRKLVRQLADQEKELAEKRMAIMISQIQPHFLYNSLNTIYHLCKKDAAQAQRAINSFSEYLRCNLSSLKRNTPVPFTEEERHVRAYLYLEQLRFRERLNVAYEIETTAFFLPALSIQPLVENAVKHGICQKEEGGTVRLSTKEYPAFFEVTVSDNGVGFLAGTIPQDGKLHVGIENVRQRLSAMCHASLTIESEPGKGTTVKICIPKEKKR